GGMLSLRRVPPSAADRVVGEKPVEGHPSEAGQARSADEHTRKVVGLFLAGSGDVPAWFV
ncbi:MAG TPA: hypothetical protein VKB35_05640, partial [Ktedonobacteraceae bacterium]|nr:hypothetical protein [Ktedonobacteraceae bacterium]